MPESSQPTIVLVRDARPVPGTEYRVIPIATQRHMAGRQNATIAEVDASRMSMMARPDATLAVVQATLEADS
jgi:hypothetical protein